MNRNENQTIIKALNMYGRVPETWELLEEIENYEKIVEMLSNGNFLQLNGKAINLTELNEYINAQQQEIERLNNIIKGLDNTIENLEEVIKHKDNIIKEVREYCNNDNNFEIMTDFDTFENHNIIGKDILEILEQGSDK